uniref:translation initiation factor IF-2-like n=1 Tax=Arvicanthis niloticus TaxID=61156 RepID=UPI001486FBF5|nr:translation initiation factor IF-2-like [Arvicanthis niloticus]
MLMIKTETEFIPVDTSTAQCEYRIWTRALSAIERPLLFLTKCPRPLQPKPPEETRNAYTSCSARVPSVSAARGLTTTRSRNASPPPGRGGAGGGGARAPPRTRPHARALPPRSRSSPTRPGGGGAAGGLRGCDAPGAAAALESGRPGAGCWARAAPAGPAGHSRLAPAARPARPAARAASAGPQAAGAALSPPPRAPPRAAPPPFPSPSRSPPGCAAR